MFAVPDSPKPLPRQITLALWMLATAESGILVATGPAKRAALERLAKGDPDLPSSALDGLTVLSDVTERGTWPPL